MAELNVIHNNKVYLITPVLTIAHTIHYKCNYVLMVGYEVNCEF